MIDLGVSKIALIGAVALIVIGPEKLPRLARTIGTLLGKAQRAMLKTPFRPMPAILKNHGLKLRVTAIHRRACLAWKFSLNTSTRKRSGG